MSFQSIRSVFICVMFVSTLLFSTQSYAHGGLSLADDICKLVIGPYTMHFTGYQPDNTQEKEFCEDIPSTGRTVVALDYIEEALRPLPTEIRVIKDTGSETDIEAITILHVPSKVYSNGSINFEHTFTQPGKFVGLVTTGDKQEHVSRFPFSVGQPKGILSAAVQSPLLILGITVFVGAALILIGRRRKQSSDIKSS